jgi:hypothetical protein
MKFVPETRGDHNITNLRFYQTRYVLLHNEKKITIWSSTIFVQS